jgi:glutamine amidotransferase
METWSNLITVIDIGIGNIASVTRALGHLNIVHKIVTGPEGLADATKLIFPGVGSYHEASRRLRQSGLTVAIREAVLEKKTPILGICLGMQLFSTHGEEGGSSEGLGLIKGIVSLHRAGQSGLNLPHIGWNDVQFENFPGFGAVKSGSCFYFVHSYEFVAEEPVKVAIADYGVPFVAGLQKDHIVGYQFHPEKSQAAGLELLKTFCN